jgi:hypothetical protein
MPERENLFRAWHTDKYLRGVWARVHELIASATEIHVIGYSFAGIDRGPILDMIETASDCRRLIIQVPDAERICARLRLDRPRLRDLIEAAVQSFGARPHTDNEGKVFRLSVGRLPYPAQCGRSHFNPAFIAAIFASDDQSRSPIPFAMPSSA